LKINENKLKKEFKQLTENDKPKPQLLTHCVRAFIIGGVICDIGQMFNNLYSKLGVPNDLLGAYVSITMVFVGAFLTGIGIYDKIAEYAGAGTVVPITGFANSIVSPAMEFKKEGFVFGVAAKMFIIAGPVLVYGVTSSVIVGIVYYFIS